MSSLLLRCVTTGVSVSVCLGGCLLPAPHKMKIPLFQRVPIICAPSHSIMNIQDLQNHPLMRSNKTEFDCLVLQEQLLPYQWQLYWLVSASSSVWLGSSGKNDKDPFCHRKSCSLCLRSEWGCFTPLLWMSRAGRWNLCFYDSSHTQRKLPAGGRSIQRVDKGPAPAQVPQVTSWAITNRACQLNNINDYWEKSPIYIDIMLMHCAS